MIASANLLTDRAKLLLRRQAVTIPNAERLRTVMKLGRGVRVVAFHLVKRGYIEVTPDGEDSVTVESGEVAICFGCIYQSFQAAFGFPPATWRSRQG